MCADVSLGIFDYLVQVLALQKHGQQLVALKLLTHLQHEVALDERRTGGALLSLVAARALNLLRAQMQRIQPVLSTRIVAD